jgi:GTPase SAR1 family protein
MERIQDELKEMKDELPIEAGKIKNEGINNEVRKLTNLQHSAFNRIIVTVESMIENKNSEQLFLEVLKELKENYEQKDEQQQDEQQQDEQQQDDQLLQYQKYVETTPEFIKHFNDYIQSPAKKDEQHFLRIMRSMTRLVREKKPLEPSVKEPKKIQSWKT